VCLRLAQSGSGAICFGGSGGQLTTFNFCFFPVPTLASLSTRLSLGAVIGKSSSSENSNLTLPASSSVLDSSSSFEVKSTGPKELQAGIEVRIL
jgi:hypothetical protein